jgi:hypothetical protein
MAEAGRLWFAGAAAPRRTLSRVHDPTAAATMTVTVDEFQVADPRDAWTRAGFSVDSDAVCRIGGVRVRLVGAGTGIVGWSLGGLPADCALDDLDGVPTKRSGVATAAPATHPNGVTAIDHVSSSGSVR